MTLAGRRRNSAVGGIAVLLIRGVLLWVAVPVAVVVWPFVALRLHRRNVTVGRYLGWLDLNLIACVQRMILRPLVQSPADWVPARDMAQVTHRLRAVDPA